jgi:hypothetical protein
LTRIEITRHAAADPASVALLLAEPVAERTAGPDSLVPTGEVGTVRRSEVGFTAAVAVAIGDGRAPGVLTVVPSRDAGCDVRIELSPSDASAAPAARAWATTFLDSLAERARVRSSAA